MSSHCGHSSLTFVSSFMLYFVSGYSMTLGNLSVYSLSYIRVYTDSSATDPAPWNLSCFFIGYGIGALLVTPLARFISKTMICISASVSFSVGMLASYITIQISVLALCLTLGLLCGVSAGMLANMSLDLLMPWVKERRGFGSSIVMASSPINSLIMNQFITLYVNPNDEKPISSTSKSELSYFNQKDILDRVPYVFLYIALIYSCTLILGCVLVREKRETLEGSNETNHTQGQVNETPVTTTEFNSNAQSDPSSISYNPDSQVKKVGDDNESISNSTSKLCIETNSYGSVITNSNSFLNSEDDTYRCKHTESYRIQLTENSSTKMTYKTLLLSKSFYVTAILVIYSVMANVIVLEYYKLFPQIWILDDHFLTDIMTAFSFSLLFIRPVWGVALDKLGIKRAYVIFFSLISVSFAWIYFTPSINQWLYCGTLYILFSTVTSNSVMLANIPVALYKEEDFSMVYGMHIASMVPPVLFLPLVLRFVFQYLGFSQLFAGMSVMGIFCLMFVVVSLPEK